MITNVVTVRPVDNVSGIFNNGGYLCAGNYILYSIAITNL